MLDALPKSSSPNFVLKAHQKTRANLHAYTHFFKARCQPRSSYVGQAAYYSQAASRSQQLATAMIQSCINNSQATALPCRPLQLLVQDALRLPNLQPYLV